MSEQDPAEGAGLRGAADAAAVAGLAGRRLGRRSGVDRDEPCVDRHAAGSDAAIPGWTYSLSRPANANVSGFQTTASGSWVHAWVHSF